MTLKLLFSFNVRKNRQEEQGRLHTLREWRVESGEWRIES